MTTQPASRWDDTRRGPTACVAILSVLLASTLHSQPMATNNGAAAYRTYCASCHGIDGHGNGPMAGVMRRQPPDVTLLSRRNGGFFPGDRVRRIVDGRDVESHGTRDMPVWGNVFKTAADASDADTSARIAAIVRYLESIQQRDAQ